MQNDQFNNTTFYKIYLTIKKLTIFLLLSFFIISSTLLFLILYLKAQPLPSTTIERTTLVYSIDGEIIDDLYSGENREYVTLNKIPVDLINATIAIEDKKFYSHFGFDLPRIGVALYENVKHKSKAQGASTITQQLAKNLYLSHEKTWTRKLQEALLAIQLELQYSKDELLEMYLNQIYYGHSANGVQLASKIYFNKDVSELTLAESSMLAGIPKGPSYYSPFIDMDKAKNRQRLILKAMVDENYITQKEADEAYSTELVFRNTDEKIYSSIAPYFRDYIIYELKNTHGLSEDEIYSGGLKIYTTLDYKAQKIAEETLTSNLPSDRELQAALISIDPSTGFIKTMVGGREYKESQYNRVFAKRQPGSSFKPFLYLAALESGYTPVTKYVSEPTVFTFENNQTYQPSNFGNKYANKEVDLRYALTHSDNIYAVKTHMDLGMDKLVDVGARLGIDTKLMPYPSLALGSQEVSPYEMTKAYATIANQGKRIEPTAILRIENHNGTVLYEKKTIEEVQVTTPEAAFTLSYLMEGVFEPGGTGYYVADRLNRPIAGKTGTTDYDSWLVGYTPQLVTTLWTGYDQNTPLQDGDSIITKEIWADYMNKVHQDLPTQFFVVPDGVVSLYIDSDTGKIATDKCPNTRLEIFIEGTEPTEPCTEHSGDEIDIKEHQTVDTPQSFWDRIKNWWYH